jgi:DNA-binding CsgD family transcriptional regulator
VAIPLSSEDLRALSLVQDALLDPLSFATIEAWLLEVCARFEALCGATAGFAAFAFRNGQAGFASREISRSYLDRMTQISMTAPGTIGGGDPTVEGVMDRLRNRFSCVATSWDLLVPGGFTADQLGETPMFRDIAFPLGVPGSTLLFHSGASGEFMLHAAYPEIARRPFDEATEAVVGALLPAFAASMGALGRLGDARQVISSLLDVLEDGVVVFDSPAQRAVTRNAAMEGILRREPDAAALLDAVQRAARATAWSPKNGKSAPVDSTAMSRGWQSATGIDYRLRAIRLPSGAMTRNEAILVLIQRVGPTVPETADLMQRFGLTRREADVAQRLAYGRSDREIAAELGLSRHTIRHHAESIFLKVGVTSRKALALHLGTAP